MPWKKTDSTESTDSAESTGETSASATAEAAAENAKADNTAPKHPKGYTPPKGRATPKRNDVERAHGTRRQAYTAPETPKEARKRRKELKNSMSKEEYQALKQRERAERTRDREIARERMMSGDERYLPDRDKGPERRLIRDWVDSRRLVANSFMPVVIVLLILMFITTATKNLMLNNLMSIVGMVVLVIIVLDGVISGRRVSAFVRERYPNTALSTWSMGFYAFSRASMIRKMRSPRPQVEIGDSI